MYLRYLRTAEITKANEEVTKVINLYDEVINKADIGSLLVADNDGKLCFASCCEFNWIGCTACYLKLRCGWF